MMRQSPCKMCRRGGAMGRDGFACGESVDSCVRWTEWFGQSWREIRRAAGKEK